MALPCVWRPMGVRIAGWLVGAVLAGASAATWISFPPEVRATFNLGQRLTLLIFGVLIGVGMHALMRSRLEATQDRLVVINGYRRRSFAWNEVLAVQLPAGAPWATLDLADGTSIPAMGIQGSETRRAQRAVAELRSMVDREGD
jgi:hypothetical protein